MGNPTLRVLIIDDDPDSGEYIQELLKAAPDYVFVADWADTPEEGLGALKRGSYDAVILDQRLGTIEGLDVIPQIRAEGHSTPIIMLSGFGSETLAKKAREAGAASYIAKQSLSVDLLVAKILLVVTTGGSFEGGQKQDPLFRELIRSNKRIGDGLDALQSEVKTGLQGVRDDVTQMHKEGLSHVDATNALIKDQIERINKHWTLRLLEWIDKNKILAAGLGVALLVLILLLVLVSQTINIGTINQLRNP